MVIWRESAVVVGKLKLGRHGVCELGRESVEFHLHRHAKSMTRP